MLEIRKDGEAKLRDVNRRLQERLVLFQQQNVENVKLARKKIKELTSSQNAGSILRIKSSPEYDKQRAGTILQICLQAWILHVRRRRFKLSAKIRRDNELLCRVLREWACVVLLAKVCTKAREKRTRRIARKCFRAWEEWVWVKHARSRRELIADDYRLYIAAFRRCFFHWKKTTMNNTKQLKHRLKFAKRLFEQRQRSRCFRAWKSYASYQSSYQFDILRRYWSYWKQRRIRSLKQTIRDRETALLTLAQQTNFHKVQT